MPTLQQRQDQIDMAVRHFEKLYPLARTSTIVELACEYLARTDGLCVTPDEVTRTLSRAAGFPLEGGA